MFLELSLNALYIQTIYIKTCTIFRLGRFFSFSIVFHTLCVQRQFEYGCPIVFYHPVRLAQRNNEVKARHNLEIAAEIWFNLEIIL